MKLCGNYLRVKVKTKSACLSIIVGLLLPLFFLTACQTGNGPTPSQSPIDVPEQVALPTPDPGGITYADISENFEITVYPARIFMDENGKRLSYKVSFLNKTESEFNRFRVHCVLSTEMQDYIASGVVMLGGYVDIGPRTKRPLKPGQGIALDAVSNSGIAADDKLVVLGLDPARLAEFAKSVTLELTWDDGEPERVSFEVEVIDETA